MSLCNCGDELRYSHRREDGSEVMSCNKQIVCASRDDLLKRNRELYVELHKRTSVINKIIHEGGTAEQYKAWAMEAMGK